MGAMENKSLNVFNSRLVLATPETASDGEFERIEGVVAHEYFHNWTGNRVTCRDWFQLTLKEGLTVYRDSEFTSDVHSRAVKRIQDVQVRGFQAEAAQLGPKGASGRPSARSPGHTLQRRGASPPLLLSHSSRTSPGAALAAVPSGRRRHGPRDPARLVPQDGQLLHRHGVREGLRGAGQGRGAPSGAQGSSLQAQGALARCARGLACALQRLCAFPRTCGLAHDLCAPLARPS